MYCKINGGKMKKLISVVIACGLPTTLLGADAVTLAEMFQTKQDNEYAYSKKYMDRELRFDAVIDSIDSKCYTRLLNWDGDTADIPCAKLNSPDTTIEMFGISVPIATAQMANPDDLLELKRDQKITLECTLTDEIIWDISSMSFQDCRIITSTTE